MKKFLVLIMISVCAVTNSQTKNNEYCFDKTVAITQISFRKSPGNEYRKMFQNFPVELEFSLEKDFETKDTICYLRKYNFAESYDFKERFKKEKEKIDKNVFYAIIKKLSEIEVDKIHQDFNVADGITCSIYLRGNNYSLSLSSNIKNENNIGYFDLFDSIWEKYK